MHFFRSVALICNIGLFFLHQVNAAIEAHDLSCPVINRKYLEDVLVYLHADSKSNEFYAKFTVIESFPINAKAHMRVLKRNPYTGEYDEPTHMKYTKPLCETVLNPSNLFWATLHKKMFAQCPSLPGTYEVAKFALLDKAHHDYFFNEHSVGRYLIILFVTTPRETLYYCHVYFRIT